VIDPKEGQRLLAEVNKKRDLSVIAEHNAQCHWDTAWRTWCIKNGGALLEFYTHAAKRSCEGGCGRTQPVLRDSKFGQRSHVGGWYCGPCHAKACNTEEPFHGCDLFED